MILRFLTAVSIAAVLSGQTPADEAAPQIPAVLDLAKHRGLVIAKVDGRPVHLEDLAAHLAAHFDPDIRQRWSDPDGARELNSPALSQLLYQFVDVLCLRAEARERNIELAPMAQHLEERLEQSFSDYLRLVAKANPTPLTEHAKEVYRRRHRREQGLSIETRALLDLLVPGRYKQSELRDFHYQHGDWFGGQIKLAHIFFGLRDPRTGRLLPASERAKAWSTARDVRDRLTEDASNFGDLARRFSEDKVTAPRGGELQAWSYRENPRLPAQMVTAAWELPDGGVSEIVESFYGLHIVRRLKLVQHTFILPGGKTWDKIAEFKAKFDKEAFLFAMRARHQRELYL